MNGRDDDRESDIGWSHGVNQSYALSLETEGNGAYERDDSDREPSLGSLTCVGSCSPECGDVGLRAFSQLNWAAGTGGDLEDEHDGCEPDADGEHEGETIGGGGSDADLY